MKADKVKNIIYKISDVIEENKLYLTELDASIGDGDHGLNLSKGFNAVKQKLESTNTNVVSDVLNTTAMALISSVGGASGPLYGTAFMKAGMSIKGKEEIDINDFHTLLEAALEGIKSRGKSTRGEKTMIDSLEPAVISLNQDIENNSDIKVCLENMLNASKNGMESTKDIIATKGRASYLGERSIGHIDAGSASCYLILKTICDEII